MHSISINSLINSKPLYYSAFSWSQTYKYVPPVWWFPQIHRLFHSIYRNTFPTMMAAFQSTGPVDLVRDELVAIVFLCIFESKKIKIWRSLFKKEEEERKRSEWLIRPHKPFNSPVTTIFVLNRSLSSNFRLCQQ